MCFKGIVSFSQPHIVERLLNKFSQLFFSINVDGERNTKKKKKNPHKSGQNNVCAILKVF